MNFVDNIWLILHNLWKKIMQHMTIICTTHQKIIQHITNSETTYDLLYTTYEYMLDYIFLKNREHIVCNTPHIDVE